MNAIGMASCDSIEVFESICVSLKCCSIHTANLKHQPQDIYVNGHFTGMQGDLQKLLYPVFTLCYLRLVKHSASAEAQQMLAKHRARFVGSAQRPAQARLQVPLLVKRNAGVAHRCCCHRVSHSVYSMRVSTSPDIGSWERKIAVRAMFEWEKTLLRSQLCSG